MVSFENFCCRLSAAIKASDYSRKELAQRLDVKPATIKSWCVGRRSPTVQRLLALAEVLDIEAETLFQPLEETTERRECAVCGRTFRREVGYRIHLALRAREDGGHRALCAQAEAQPTSASSSSRVAAVAG